MILIMSVKYFVYAGGRWCEVDAGSGRVAGWRRRARFLFVRHGRLQAARSAAVLRGLKALAAGQPSSVRDGPPLSQRRRYRRPARKKQPSACSHHHCCNDAHAHRCSNIIEASPQKVIELASPRKADACVQVTVDASTDTRDRYHPTAILHQPTQVIPRTKRKRSLSDSATTKKARVDNSEEQNTPRDIQTQPSKENCKELIINEEDADLYRTYLIRNDPSFDLYRFDADEEYKLKTFFRINPLVNVERCTRIERMLRGSRSQDEMSLKDFAIKLGLRSVSDQESEQTRRYKMRRRFRKEDKIQSSSSDTEKENEVQARKVVVKDVRMKENTDIEPKNLRRRLMVETVKKNISKERELRVESREKPSYAENNISEKRELRVGTREKPSYSDNNISKERELRVETRERRSYAENNIIEKRELRVGTREKLSYVEKNISKERELRVGSRERRSYAENNISEKRELRFGTREKPSYVEKNISKERELRVESRERRSYAENNISKERELRVETREKPSYAEKNNSEERELRVESREKRSYAEVDLSTSPENSESDFVKKKPRLLVKKVPPIKKFPIRLTAQSQQSVKSQGSKRSGVGGNREYSNLEDHAIVSWLSNGSRARMVNGNRVWRELQPHYQRLTGTQRSWHSLRNRYLRYILPALGSLALSPHEAQRLRAAAAAGELKSKNRSWRRNSLLEQPRTAPGAWARRPQAPPSASPPHAPSPPSSSSSSSSSTSPPPSAPSRHSRGHSAESDSSPTPSSPTTRRVLRSSGVRSPVARRSLPRAVALQTPGSYEEVTRRFALRHRFTPRSSNHSPEKSQESQGTNRVTRRRGLYNPNAPMTR